MTQKACRGCPPSACTESSFALSLIAAKPSPLAAFPPIFRARLRVGFLGKLAHLFGDSQYDPDKQNPAHHCEDVATTRERHEQTQNP